MSAFPQPWCPTCAAASDCRAHGSVRGDYPACREPLRYRQVDNAVRLLSWMCTYHGVDDVRVERLLASVVHCLDADGGFSEIFEPSLCHDAAGWHLLRFSYGFPGFRDSPEAGLERLHGLCAAFDEEVAAHVQRLRPALCHPCVEQPLFGIAYDSPTSWRVKLYLQFRDDAGAAATELAAAIIGSAELTELAAGAPLHLVGLDLGSHGLSAAKLYFLHADIGLAELRRTVGPVPAIGGVTRLRNLLRIHRVRSPGDAGSTPPSQIDFALAENALLPADVDSFLAGEPYSGLRSAFSVALRRISLAVGDSGNANGYYVLTE